MGLGIIMGALGGAGEAMSRIGEMQMKADLDREARVQEFDLTTNRARLVEAIKAQRATQDRTQQVSRIDAEAGRLADESVAEKRGIINSGIVNREYWTAEHQASVDAALALERKRVVNDGGTRTMAAIRTGDISPFEAANLAQKDDGLLYRQMWEKAREDGRNDRADARLASQQESSDKRLAYLFAALERKGNKGDGDTTKAALQFLEGSRKEAASEAQLLKSLYQAELNAAVLPDDKARVKTQFEPKLVDLDRKRAQIEQDYGSMRARVGLPPIGGASAPMAAPVGAPRPAAAAKPGTSRPPLSSYVRP